MFFYFQALVIVRNPFGTLRSYFNYIHTRSHTRVIGTAQLTSENEEAEVRQFMKSEILNWKAFHIFWLKHKRVKSITRCFIFYDDLLNNLTEGLKRMAHFLGFNVSNEVLECMRRNSEGKFHRHRTREMEEFFEKVMDDKLTHKFNTSYQKVIDLVKQKGFNNC